MFKDNSVRVLEFMLRGHHHNCAACSMCHRKPTPWAIQFSMLAAQCNGFQDGWYHTFQASIPHPQPPIQAYLFRVLLDQGIVLSYLI